MRYLLSVAAMVAALGASLMCMQQEREINSLRTEVRTNETQLAQISENNSASIQNLSKAMHTNSHDIEQLVDVLQQHQGNMDLMGEVIGKLVRNQQVYVRSAPAQPCTGIGDPDCWTYTQVNVNGGAQK